MIIKNRILWLQNNMKVIAAIAVTLATLLISYLQWDAADTQAEISKLQTIILKESIKPRFYIDIEEIYEDIDDRGMYLTTFNLNIKYDSSKVYELRMDAHFYIIVSIPKDKIRKRIDLKNFFFHRVHDIDGNNSSVNMYLKNNWHSYVNFERVFREYCTKNGILASIDYEIILDISYIDILKQSHNEHFKVDSITGNFLVDSDSLIEIESIKSDIEGGIDIEKVTPELVFDQIYND